MYNFNDIIKRARSKGPKKLVVAVAEDKDVLMAVKHAQKENLIRPILIGDENKIRKIAQDISFDLSKSEIINENDIENASLTAVSIVSSGQADIVMKGLVDTSIILKAILSKEKGLRTGSILNHVGVFQLEKYHKLILLTDAAMNIAPDFEQKKQILENTVQFAHALGIKTPKVAIICAKEKVNPKMQHTVDARGLVEFNNNGIINGCIIAGPLALDNAISKKAAEQKGIKHTVAGDADILLMPNIEAGNVLYKSLTFLSDSVSAGLLLGANAPIVITSRADNDRTKINSIALAVLQSAN